MKRYILTDNRVGQIGPTDKRDLRRQQHQGNDQVIHGHRGRNVDGGSLVVMSDVSEYDG